MESQKSELIDDSLFAIFQDTEFGDTDLLSILETLQDLKDFPPINNEALISPTMDSQKLSVSSSAPQDSETDPQISPKNNTKNLCPTLSHITVERNRRKQMNHNLSVLRSLMPSFYVKRVIRSHIFKFYNLSSILYE